MCTKILWLCLRSLIRVHVIYSIKYKEYDVGNAFVAFLDQYVGCYYVFYVGDQLLYTHFKENEKPRNPGKQENVKL